MSHSTSKMRKLSLRLLIPSIAVAVLLAGCSGAPATPGTDTPAPTEPSVSPLLDDLAASAEDKVEMLTFGNAADWSDPNTGLGYIIAQFNKEYPNVKVNVTGFIDNSVHAYLDGQESTGKWETDLIMYGLSTGVVQKQADSGRLMPFSPPTADKVPAELRDPGNLYIVGLSAGYIMLYNTTMYKENELPTTIDELIDPKWKGKFGFTKPNGAAPSDAGFAVLNANNKISNDQIQGLLENAELFQDQPTTMKSVAQGRVGFALWAPTSVGLTMARTGAPVAVATSDIQYLGAFGFGVTKEAPHPNAAKLLQSWFFTPNGQAAIATGWNNYSPVPGAPAPKGAPATDSFTLTPLPIGKVGPETRSFFDSTTSPMLGKIG